MSGSRIFVRSGDSYYRSSPKKNSKKTKSHSSPVKHKESWNIYLSDNDRYKLSDEEMNRRKESIAYSPNNILYSPSKVTPSPSKGFIKNVNLNKKGFTFASPKKLASQFDLVSPRVTVKPVTQHMSLLKNSLINSRLPINIENDVDDDEDDDLFHLNFDSTSQSPSQDDFKKSKTKSKMTTKKPIKSTNSHKYEKIADEMMFQEVASQVESLLGEIRHYEQLSGRRSCFDAEVSGILLNTIRKI